MKRTKLIVLVISCCALILFVLFALSSPTLTVARAATVVKSTVVNRRYHSLTVKMDFECNRDLSSTAATIIL